SFAARSVQPALSANPDIYLGSPFNPQDGRHFISRAAISTAEPAHSRDGRAGPPRDGRARLPPDGSHGGRPGRIPRRATASPSPVRIAARSPSVSVRRTRAPPLL